MRPRERLVARGAVSLSDDELLALIIGSGTKKHSALVLANELLRAIGGLRALGQADVARLRHHMVGLATAVRSCAACELGRRAVIATTGGERCDTAELAAAALGPHLAHLEREQLVIGLLSREQRLIAVAPTYAGSVSGTPCRSPSCSPRPSAGRRRASSSRTTIPAAIRRRPPTTSGPPAMPCGQV